MVKLNAIPLNFSLRDRVYEMLRDAIVEMDIYAADADLRLDERTLAAQLGVSRTPLREAITRLQRDGLVDVVPRKGIFVQRKSLVEILEMIVAWAALESMAARLACEHASDAEIASLRGIAQRYGDAARPTRISEYSDDNIRFHQRILEISQCGLLKQMADGLFLHMHAVRRQAMGEGDRAERSVVDHAGIIEALEERDADKAARRVREHTMRLHDHIRQRWTAAALDGAGAQPDDGNDDDGAAKASR